jgi:hypothetical protein
MYHDRQVSSSLSHNHYQHHEHHQIGHNSKANLLEYEPNYNSYNNNNYISTTLGGGGGGLNAASSSSLIMTRHNDTIIDDGSNNIAILDDEEGEEETNRSSTKLFTCDQCEHTRSFNKKRFFLEHMKMQHSAKPYKCNACQKR